MKAKTIRGIGALVLVLLWGGLTVWAWCKPADQRSEAERRALAQAPELTWENIMEKDDEEAGTKSFMTEFKEYSVDQFPLRDAWRTLKALFHYKVMGNQDNNGFVITDGYIVKQDLALNAVELADGSTQSAVDQKLDVLNTLYESHIAGKGANVYVSVIPDKSYCLARDEGAPSLDYDALIGKVQERTQWGEYIHIADLLTLEDYYHTDTHWRQEKIVDVAQRLCQAMGGEGPRAEDFTVKEVERPFYGVYYLQAAMPLGAETMYTLESKTLKNTTVTVEMAVKKDVYDYTADLDEDLYYLFLSGSKGYITLENPNAATDKELVIFRDSFTSSLAPLMMEDYRKVTLIDMRLMNPTAVGMTTNFKNADVLFLYSTLVLNNTETFKQ